MDTGNDSDDEMISSITGNKNSTTKKKNKEADDMDDFIISDDEIFENNESNAARDEDTELIHPHPLASNNSKMNCRSNSKKNCRNLTGAKDGPYWEDGSHLLGTTENNSTYKKSGSSSSKHAASRNSNSNAQSSSSSVRTSIDSHRYNWRGESAGSDSSSDFDLSASILAPSSREAKKKGSTVEMDDSQMSSSNTSSEEKKPKRPQKSKRREHDSDYQVEEEEEEERSDLTGGKDNQYWMDASHLLLDPTENRNSNKSSSSSSNAAGINRIRSGNAQSSSGVRPSIDDRDYNWGVDGSSTGGDNSFPRFGPSGLFDRPQNSSASSSSIQGYGNSITGNAPSLTRNNNEIKLVVRPHSYIMKPLAPYLTLREQYGDAYLGSTSGPFLAPSSREAKKKGSMGCFIVPDYQIDEGDESDDVNDGDYEDSKGGGSRHSSSARRKSKKSSSNTSSEEKKSKRPRKSKSRDHDSDYLIEQEGGNLTGAKDYHYWEDGSLLLDPTEYKNRNNSSSSNAAGRNRIRSGNAQSSSGVRPSIDDRDYNWGVDGSGTGGDNSFPRFGPSGLFDRPQNSSASSSSIQGHGNSITGNAPSLTRNNNDIKFGTYCMSPLAPYFTLREQYGDDYVGSTSGPFLAPSSRKAKKKVSWADMVMDSFIFPDDIVDLTDEVNSRDQKGFRSNNSSSSSNCDAAGRNRNSIAQDSSAWMGVRDRFSRYDGLNYLEFAGPQKGSSSSSSTRWDDNSSTRNAFSLPKSSTTNGSHDSNDSKVPQYISHDGRRYIPDSRHLEHVSHQSKKRSRQQNQCVEEQSAESDSKYCCICLANLKCVVLLPCAHLCVCSTCSGLEDSKSASIVLKDCPICRATIKQRIKVFM